MEIKQSFHASIFAMIITLAIVISLSQLVIDIHPPKTHCKQKMDQEPICETEQLQYNTANIITRYINEEYKTNP